MSVHRISSDGKRRWAVRWREAGRNRQRTFDKRADAVAWESRTRRQRQLRGAAELAAEQTTLAEYASAWWTAHAEPNLSEATLSLYATALDLRVLPALGAMKLSEITPAHVERLIADLRRDGVGDPSILKATSVLSAIFSRAVANGLVQANPVRAVRKPRQRPTRRPEPIAPATTERIRAQLDIADATLISVLAYCGARPESEALALRWRDVGERTIALTGSKTQRERHVRLLPTLAEDLRTWRDRCSPVSDSAFVFARSDGGPWTATDWDNWRRRVWKPAAEAAGLKGSRPRDLRGSYASLLIAAGQSVVEVAEQLGHSPVMCLNTYARAFAEFDPENRVSAERAIRDARERARESYRPAAASGGTPAHGARR
jgi:integrase